MDAAASCGETFFFAASQDHHLGQDKNHLYRQQKLLWPDLLWHLAEVLKLAKTPEGDEYFQLMIQISYPPSQGDSCAVMDVPLYNFHAVLVAVQQGQSSLHYF